MRSELPDLNAHPCSLVVMGASLGGLDAVRQLLSPLPRDFPLPIVILQHVGEGSDSLSLEILQRLCSLLVCEPEDHEQIVPGRVYLAPAGYHLLVSRGFFELSTDPPVLHSRPSIDVLFESAALAYGDQAVGILLTGASQDGARGLLEIRRRGGLTLVQDPQTAQGKIMPAAALTMGAADQGHSLTQLAAMLARMRPPAQDQAVSARDQAVQDQDLTPADQVELEVEGHNEVGELPLVLLVDDNPLNLTAYSAVLQSPSWQVVTARSGEEALRRLLENREYALVLLDVRMPGMDGFEVVELMRKRPRLQHVPVCFFTASISEREMVSRAYKVGVVDFLTKPVDPLLLRAKVRVFTDLWGTTQKLVRVNQSLINQAQEIEQSRRREASLQLESKQQEGLKRAQTEARVLQQEVLLELASNPTQELKQSYLRTTAAALHVLNIERCSVWLTNAERTQLRCEHMSFAYEHPDDDDVQSAPSVLIDACPSYFQALESGTVIAVEDTLKDPRTCELAKNYLQPMGISSLIDVPLRHQGVLCGVLCCEHIGPKRSWQEGEEGFAMALADRLILAFESDERAKAEKELLKLNSELQQSEAQLKSSLTEKEVLLSEIHHRVKNNLQIVSSLLQMQASQSQDEKFKALLAESLGRIRSMSLIHEVLYQSQQFARVDFRQFLQQLCASLQNAYGQEAGELRFSVNVEALSLKIETAIPCGLMVNEFITNAIKHGYPQGGTGHIWISAEVLEGQLKLSVANDGLALKNMEQKPKSLGITIVNLLTRQLGGSLTVQTDAPVQFTVQFPWKEEVP